MGESRIPGPNEPHYDDPDFKDPGSLTRPLGQTPNTQGEGIVERLRVMAAEFSERPGPGGISFPSDAATFREAADQLEVEREKTKQVEAERDAAVEMEGVRMDNERRSWTAAEAAEKEATALREALEEAEAFLGKTLPFLPGPADDEPTTLRGRVLAFLDRSKRDVSGGDYAARENWPRSEATKQLEDLAQEFERRARLAAPDAHWPKDEIALHRATSRAYRAAATLCRKKLEEG